MRFNRASEIGIHTENKIFLYMEIGKKGNSIPVFPLLDTGATGTMFPKSFAELLGVNYSSGRSTTVNGISGSLIGKIHKIETALFDDDFNEIGRHMIDVTFVEKSNLSIIGMNFLMKFDWSLIFSRKKIEAKTP